MADELERIEAKLTALLAILLERHLRETDSARAKPRSIDKMLSDAGLATRDIAALLGKTERAVQKQLQGAKRPTRRGR